MNNRVVRVVEDIVFKRPVEASAIIRCQRQSLGQTVHQIWVTDKVPAVKKSVIFSGFHNTPRVGIIETSSGEERSGAEDLAEPIESHILQPPALEEGVLLVLAEDLFIALNRGVSLLKNVLNDTERYTGSTKLT